MMKKLQMSWMGVGGVVVLALIFTGTTQVGAWGTSDKVKLKDVEVLTLYQGRMTTGKRSQGVPQLMCVGGNAGCGAFTPQVVQCYNRGSDGFDVQWECKTDMDNAYRFGKVDVTCEGYDYPEDPYVLRGSCGLEYTLDLTKEGMAGQQGGQHNYYGEPKANSYGWNPNVYPQHKKGSNTITNLACGAVVVIIVYAIYKTCIAPVDHTSQRSRTNDDYSDPRGPGSRPPPPPGFRPGYTPGSSDSFGGGGDSCAGSSQGSSGGPRAGGFWTGAATGGLLGYLFGSRNDSTGAGYGYTGGYARPRTSYGFGEAGPSTSSYGWGGGGSSSSSGFSSGSSSSGTRTASGFGGTRRR